MTKRLFIFAAYDPDNIVDDTLLHYLNALSPLGDIVFTMDCDIPATELAKVTSIPNVIHATAARHGEYDFGSYKRGYQYARDNKLLNKYDWVYLVNDSVYGPLWNLEPVLVDLESRGVDLTGMIDFEETDVPCHVQSWFMGLSKTLATADFISDFMDSICHQDNKGLIILKYEFKLSTIIQKHGYKMHTFIAGQHNNNGHEVYVAPFPLIKRGMPFVKKDSIPNMLSHKHLYIYTSEQLTDQIYDNYTRTKPKIILNDSSQPRKYLRTARLTFLSLPILSIYAQIDERSHLVSYKGRLFDFVTIFKFSKVMK